MSMIEQAVELLNRLRDKDDRNEFEHFLYEAACRFITAFYLNQEAQLTKATKDLDAELARNSEPLS